MKSRKSRHLLLYTSHSERRYVAAASEREEQAVTVKYSNGSSCD